MQSFSVRYIILFSLAICGVCAIFVSSLAVTLGPQQEINKQLDRKKNVLLAAGLLSSDEEADKEEIEKRFASFTPMVVDLETGKEVPDVDPATYDQRKARVDPERSRQAPPNKANVARMPYRALVYTAKDASGNLDKIVIPVEGYGLWSTLYGFLALEEDTTTIGGLAFYEHGETPGLGGEVENENWRALWPGRKAYNEEWEPSITVIKGSAGSVEEAPYEVDGLSGATITARGVSHMMELWLGDEGFGPYLENLRKGAV